MLEKLTDALSMFWQSLDERERTLVLLGGLWLASSVFLAAGDQKRRREEERLIARLREEMRTS